MNIQHGDVLLKVIGKLPDGAKKVLMENGCLILMRGETTGHAHIIKSAAASLWDIKRGGVTELYLKVNSPVAIYHDEHKPLPVPPGIYQVGQVKEYDYFRDMERNVVD